MTDVELAVELAYVAGFFDGEGCINIACIKGRYYELQVSIGQKNKDNLERISSVFSGTITTVHRQTGDFYNMQWSGSSAATFLKSVLPYLRGKRLQAQIAIEFQSYRDLNRGNRYKSLTKENITVYKTCRDRLLLSR